MQSLKAMEKDAFEVIKQTQTKRNEKVSKLVHQKRSLETLQEQKEMGSKVKGLDKEILKLTTEIENIEEDIKDTEFDEDENPATYTTDELSITRAIKCLNLCMKLHQNLCENHNVTLQNTIRQQCNEDNKPK